MATRVRLRVHSDKRSGLAALAVLTLLVLSLLAYLGLGQRMASAAAELSPQSPAFVLRQYYLTNNGFRGDEALDACVPGYHMASLWEILDPSNLKYNNSLGETAPADRGQGPPSYPFWGWVRTGYSSDNSATPGHANCNGWTTTSGYGTYASVTDAWTSGLADVHVWEVDTGAGTWDCGDHFRVWCVADQVGESVYLPLVVR